MREVAQEVAGKAVEPATQQEKAGPMPHPPQREERLAALEAKVMASHLHGCAGDREAAEDDALHRDGIPQEGPDVAAQNLQEERVSTAQSLPKVAYRERRKIIFLS